MVSNQNDKLPYTIHMLYDQNNKKKKHFYCSRNRSVRSDFLLHLVERTEKEQQQGEVTTKEKSSTGKPSI